MRAPLDRALFPQSLLRFLSTGERLGAAPHRMIDVFLSAFDVSGARRGELATLAARLQAGGTLAAEAPKHPQLFPPWLAALFRFGQKSGRMQDALDRAAEELDREARAGRAVTCALAYPAMLVTAGLGILAFCAQFIAPSFRSIMSALKVLPPGSAVFDAEWPLPALCARVFLELGGWSGTIGALLVAWMAVVAVALVPRLPGHRAVLRAMRWLVPGIGAVDRHAREGLVARLLAAGLSAGLPLPELLDELADLPDLGEHNALLRDAAARLRMGATPAEAFARAEGSAAEPFALGLATALTGGQPEQVLARLAEVSTARAVDGLVRLPASCGPFYTLVLGALISFLPVAQFSLLFRLLSVLTSY